jgi:ribosomal protein S19
MSSRSLKKLPYIHPDILLKRNKVDQIRTVFTRNSLIPSKLLGKTLLIYNGKRFNKVICKVEHIGLRAGELSITRKNYNKTGKKPKQNKVKKK